MSTNKFMDTNGDRRTNKRWPEALKREIVAASYAPGASVATVARQYGVNANQVFNWRRCFGPSSKPVPAPPQRQQPRPRLVPVTIGVEPETTAAPTSDLASDGAIEIDVADTYRVRVRAGFDCRVLRRVLDCLVRR